MKNCPKCQATVSDNAKFCIKCGFNIKKYEEENAQQEYFCPECGTKFSGGIYCPECGTSINGELNADVDTGATLAAFDFSSLQIEAQNQVVERELSAFEYEQMSNGKYVIKRIKSNDELIVNIPDSVQIIGEGAFADSSVIEVTLPESLIKIGARAFANCKDLEAINIPSSLRLIEEEAFWGCIQLDLEQPENVRCEKDAFKNTLSWIRKENESKPKELEKHTEKKKHESEQVQQYTSGLQFRRCRKSYYIVTGYVGDSKDVIIPSTYNDLPVKKIDGYAFNGSSVQSIVIPDSVTSIELCAFANNESLKSVTIPDSVETFGIAMFLGCSGVTIKASQKMAETIKEVSEGYVHPEYKVNRFGAIGKEIKEIIVID